MPSTRRLGLLLFVLLAALILVPRPVAAERKGLASSATGAGAMRVTADQYGTFSGARFTPADGAASFGWQYFGSLMLTDGTQYVWLADEDDWSQQLGGGPTWVDHFLPDSDQLSDVVEGAKRTSEFHVSSLRNLTVDLIQEVPETGYNFLQTYTFTNPSTEPISLKMVLINDQDHARPLHDRVGFVLGPMPRMYFIDDQDLAGPGDPGVDDRPNRISVITQPGHGLHFDGYLGVWVAEAGAIDVLSDIGPKRGIPDQVLNMIRSIVGGTPTRNNYDLDADGLVDRRGDVGGALQFSVDLPANGSTSLGINYVGGSLQNAVFQETLPPALQAGDADRDLDFDQLDLVRVQIAAKYLTGQAATWGEGDWNGAPGGSAQSPPAGDGQFNQLDIVAALGAGKYLTGAYAALAPGGVRGDALTSIVYNAETGQIAIDAPAGRRLTSINIDSAAGILTRVFANYEGPSLCSLCNASIRLVSYECALPLTTILAACRREYQV